MESNGGITKFVQDAMKKEMVVNITFVDKQPAEVIETLEVVQETSNSATVLIPGPVDEINTRSENV
jgi:methionine synthase II (cobalamin-independent)